MTATQPLATNALLAEKPPCHSLEKIKKWAEELHDLSGEISILTSERDQNCLLRDRRGQGFVLKISNASEPVAMTDFQVKALLHLESTSPGLAVPRMVSTRTGQFLTDLGDGSTFRVLTYLEGVPLYRTARNERQTKALGRALAQLTEGLQTFDHPASDHELQWDIKHAQKLGPMIPAINDLELRKLSERFLSEFEDSVQPHLNFLPTQVVHSDLNPHNVLVDMHNADQIAGILDFGDMVKTPRICDVAIAVSYLIDPQQPISGISAFLDGFGAVLPLTQAETDLLIVLIKARMVTTLAITSWRAARQPENATYILRNFASAETGLRTLDQIDPILASAAFRLSFERTAS